MLTLRQKVLILLGEYMLASLRPLGTTLRMLDGKNKDKTIHATLQRLGREGYVEKVTRGGKILFRVTTEGREEIATHPPRIKRQRWDSKWRIVVFDIPERRRKERNLLRERLKALGFGRLQDSVWLSPYDWKEKMEKIAQGRDLGEHVRILIGSCHGFQDNRELVNTVWDLEEIDQAYQKFIEDFSLKFKKMVKLSKASGSILKKGLYRLLLKELEESYAQILLRDPLLPQELLPRDWKGWEAQDFYQKWLQRLKRRCKQ